MAGLIAPATLEQIRAANHLRVFVGHGRQDGVVERSATSRDVLEAHGYDVTLYDYDGGHMIAQSALGEMFKWIEAGVPDRPPGVR